MYTAALTLHDYQSMMVKSFVLAKLVLMRFEQFEDISDVLFKARHILLSRCTDTFCVVSVINCDSWKTISHSS